MADTDIEPSTMFPIDVILGAEERRDWINAIKSVELKAAWNTNVEVTPTLPLNILLIEI